MRLVLLPGMDGTGASLESVRPHLAPEVEASVIAYPPDVVLDYAQLEAHVRERLPAEGPFWLLGESFSGPLSVRLAADPPPGLVGLILDATFLTCPLSLHHRLGYRVFRTTLFRHQVPQLLLSRRLFDPDVPVEQLVTFKRAVDRVRPEVMLARVRMMEEVDVRAELRRVPVPVAYLQATRDRMVGPWALRQVQRERPDVRVKRVVGPHLVLMRNPRHAARAIRWLMGSEDSGEVAPPAPYSSSSAPASPSTTRAKRS